MTAVKPVASAAALPHLPLNSFPRTVMVETFTAQWCIYCEMESQALYYIEHNTNANVMQIGELHICYSPSNCGDNYATPDGTANARGNYYSVTAFPTVYFDGTNGIIGAATTLAQMESWYEGKISNASQVPGNVSIDQTAMLTGPGSVTSHSSVTSAVNGTFRVLTYFIEYIGLNDSTGHDLGWVVRGTLADRTVTFTAGSSTEVSGTKVIGTTWNIQHMAIVTIVQDNATKIIENTNMVRVSTMSISAMANPATVNGGSSTAVTVQVTNSSTGSPLAGASVALSVDGGAVLSPTTGVTASDGTFTTNFSAPRVSAVQVFTVTAQASLAGYLGLPATASITVDPLYPPGLPTNVSIVPQTQDILVSWSAPASGGGGVSYHVYRADAQGGPYSEVAVTTQTSFTDVGVGSDQSYWYMVNAEDIGGFSINTTAVSAIAVVIAPQGISPYTGWWFAIDSYLMNSTTSASLWFHLPEGSYTYTFGSYSNAYLAPGSLNTLTVGTSLVQQSITFLPNYATLTGTVTPVTATVTVNGSAIQVIDGAFSQPMVAGTYTIKVTADGYDPNTTAVTLTPGNTSSVTVALSPASASGGASVSGLSTMAFGEIAAAVVIGLALVLGTVVMLQRRRGPRQGRRSHASRPPASEP